MGRCDDDGTERTVADDDGNLLLDGLAGHLVRHVVGEQHARLDGQPAHVLDEQADVVEGLVGQLLWVSAGKWSALVSLYTSLSSSLSQLAYSSCMALTTIWVKGQLCESMACDCLEAVRLSARCPGGGVAVVGGVEGVGRMRLCGRNLDRERVLTSLSDLSRRLI